jgi:hypothetical protein
MITIEGSAKLVQKGALQADSGTKAAADTPTFAGHLATCETKDGI